MSNPLPTQRFGYRGRALTIVGLVWMLVGVSVLYTPYQDRDHPLLLEQLPLWFRVFLWVGTGAVALVTAWWPTGADRWGFIALVIPAVLRAGTYSWAALLGVITGGDIGKVRAWPDALAWGLVTMFVLLLAGWPEPGQRPETREAR